LKKIDEAETFRLCDPELTFNVHVPIADCEESAALNTIASSGVYVPADEHNAVGTDGKSDIGRI
jgi:hypothetical protein